MEWAKAEDDGGADKVVLRQEELLGFARVVNCNPHIVGMQGITHRQFVKTDLKKTDGRLSLSPPPPPQLSLHLSYFLKMRCEIP